MSTNPNLSKSTPTHRWTVDLQSISERSMSHNLGLTYPRMHSPRPSFSTHRSVRRQENEVENNKKWVWIQIGLKLDPIKVEVTMETDLPALILEHEELKDYAKGKLQLYHCKEGKKEILTQGRINFDMIGEDIIFVKVTPAPRCDISPNMSPINSPRTQILNTSSDFVADLDSSRKTSFLKTIRDTLPRKITSITHSPNNRDSKSIINTAFKFVNKQKMMGSAIVDWLMKEKQVTSRQKGIEMGTIFVNSRMLYEIGGASHTFKDDNTLYKAFEEEDLESLLSSPSLVQFKKDQEKISSWSENELKMWLSDIVSPEYECTFSKNGVKLSDLVNTNDSVEPSPRMLKRKENFVLNRSNSEEKKLFVVDNDNPHRIVLEKATKDTLLELFLLSPNAQLCLIFNVNEFTQQFLCVFPEFLSGMELFKFLTVRFNDANTTLADKERILTLLNNWMNLDDGFDFYDMVKEVEEFIENIANTQPQERFWNISEFFRNKLEKILYFKCEREMGHISKLYFTLPPEPIIPKINPSQLSITEIDPLELARQITLIMEQCMLKITRHEFLKRHYDPKYRKDKAPNFYCLMGISDHIMGVCAAEILKEPLKVKQAEQYTFFVAVAEELRKLNNFFGVGVIVGALHGAAIRKLKKMAELLDEKTRRKSEMLKNLVVPILDEDVQINNYTKAIESIPSDPIIPLFHSRLGIGSLTQLDETRQDVLQNPESEIDWYKLSRVAKIINHFKQNRRGYSLTEKLDIQTVINETESWQQENVLCRIAILRNQYDIWPFGNLPKREETGRLWESDWIELSDEDWSFIITATCAKLCSFEKDQQLLEPDKTYKSIYRLVKGRVSVMRKTEDSCLEQLQLVNLKTKHSNMSTPGKVRVISGVTIFGELSYFDLPSKISVIGILPGQYYEIDINKIKNFCLLNDNISRKFNRYMAWKAARWLKQHMVGLPTNSVKISRDQKYTKKIITPDRLSMSILGEGENVLKNYKCSIVKKSKNQDCIFVVTDHQFMFHTRVFGPLGKVTSVMPISSANIEPNKDVSLKIGHILLKNFDCSIMEVYDYIKPIWEREKSNETSLSSNDKMISQNPVRTTSFKLRPTLLLNEEDWKLIKQGAYLYTFNTDDIIIQKGISYQRLYQVVSGRVRELNGSTRVNVEHMDLQADDIFGEAALLHTGSAHTSFVAIEKTQVIAIEAFYLNILFQLDPSLTGRFFCHLAKGMWQKLLKCGYF